MTYTSWTTICLPCTPTLGSALRRDSRARALWLKNRLDGGRMSAGALAGKALVVECKLMT